MKKLLALLLCTLPVQALAAEPMTDQEKKQLSYAVARCWTTERKMPVVKVLAQMNADGSLASVQISASETEKYKSHGVYKMMADQAMDQLRHCDLTSALPADKYEQWKELELTLDPQKFPNPEPLPIASQHEGIYVRQAQ